MENKVIDIRSLYFTENLKRELDAILEKPLTIIDAPMGYGKTVAVKEFFKSHQADVLWVSLSGCPKNGYWDMFCQWLEEQFPGAAQIAAQLREEWKMGGGGIIR